MEEKKFVIELTETQLRLIADCVEDCHRFMGGQMEMWNMTSLLDEYHEVKDRLESIKPLVVPMAGYYGWNGGVCENEHQRHFIARTYPIYREIRHFLALYKNQDNVYCSPTLTCAEGGEPVKIRLKE